MELLYSGSMLNYIYLKLRSVVGEKKDNESACLLGVFTIEEREKSSHKNVINWATFFIEKHKSTSYFEFSIFLLIFAGALYARQVRMKSQTTHNWIRQFISDSFSFCIPKCRRYKKFHFQFLIEYSSDGCERNLIIFFAQRFELL